uniref:Uncharacterized protein n=1 Tax=Tanacetum cinerariifolium TaxID=118510 RepID=A0A6L2JVQ5_TANCI|nr:hypothetical protein [Tanacetum cinerariifolium]
MTKVGKQASSDVKMPDVDSESAEAVPKEKAEGKKPMDVETHALADDLKMLDADPDSAEAVAKERTRMKSKAKRWKRRVRGAREAQTADPMKARKGFPTMSFWPADCILMITAFLAIYCCWSQVILTLKSEFLMVVTKEMLVRHIFVPSYDGRMVCALQHMQNVEGFQWVTTAGKTRTTEM